MMPMAGAFAVPSDEPTVSEVVVASAHDCCDQSMPADHAMKDCQAAAGCTAKCFNFYALVFSGVAGSPPRGRAGTPGVKKNLPFQAGRPPPPAPPPLPPPLK